jgi:hypothetical protein
VIFKHPSLAGKESQRVQAEKRMSLPAPEYPPLLDYEKLVKQIVVEDFRTNQKNVWLLYHSRRRRDMYRVLCNGKAWAKSAGYSRIMAEIRKNR